VDDPPGNATDYANRAQQLETRFKNNIEALVQSLGLEKRDVHEDDDGLEP
jgi:hypothetical protein